MDDNFDDYRDLEAEETSDDDPIQDCSQCFSLQSQLSKAAGKIRFVDDLMRNEPDEFINLDDRKNRLLRIRNQILDSTAEHNQEHLYGRTPSLDDFTQSDRRYFAIIRELTATNTWRVVLVVQGYKRVQKCLKRLRLHVNSWNTRDVIYRHRLTPAKYMTSPAETQQLLIQEDDERLKDNLAWTQAPSSW